MDINKQIELNKKMDANTKTILIAKQDRSLSEEFHSRSPNTQQYIKSFVGTTPTSKHKKYTAEKAPEIISASPNTLANIDFWMGK